MTASLFRDGFPSAHRTTRQRLESSLDLHRLFFAIDSDPALIGAGVVYIDQAFNVVTLRDFKAVCRVHPIKVVLREAPRDVGPVEFKRMLEHEPRESKLVSEAMNTALTCAGALLSWVAITSGVALIPFTAGVSVVISFIGKAALVASGAQCFIGLGRAGAEVLVPRDLDKLNNEAWFQAVAALLDAIALLGVATSALTVTKTVNTTRKVTGKSFTQVLRGLNRQERVKLNNELLRLQDPRLIPKMLKIKQANKVLPKRISATKMRQATANHIQETLAAALGLTGSAISGNVKTLAIGIYEEVPQ